MTSQESSEALPSRWARRLIVLPPHRGRLVAIGLGLAVWCGGAPLAAAQTPGIAPGVSLELARHRRATIDDIRYELAMAVPADRAAPVTGTVSIRFRLRRQSDVVLDFRAPSGHLGAASVNGRPVTARWSPDHVTIPATALAVGENRVVLAFTATDLALNRRGDHFYTLFVPDRASTAFPCFDQPDLKGRFRIALTVPAAWTAVANGSTVRDSVVDANRRVEFAETAPISTYLVAFAAGMLQREDAVRDGRRFTMYHRETDSAKVARNRDAIFDLHAAALRWLEDYTGIKYPFEKFDFFAVPAFQFGGMEHPGAVWYNTSGLFLERAATRNQVLSRASVIAHETAHMWFGDLVTMRWFDDVWMKEVFANFMASKIVEPAFPDVNHRLRFFLAHHPSAYEVDRTAGTNPIRQPLDNLADAGSLYGAIIYQKAPIVMRQLERSIGETAMRDGLRRYLARHQFGNADWGDLIAILDSISPADLTHWSRSWVEESGRPVIRVERVGERQVRVTEVDPTGRGRRWPQPLSLAIVAGDSVRHTPVRLRAGRATVRLDAQAELILPGADGEAYGRFVLDNLTLARLAATIPRLADPVTRSVAWQTLFDETVDGRYPADSLLAGALSALPGESDPLISQQLLGILQPTFWRYLDGPRRARVAPSLEATLWGALNRAAEPGRKAAFFNALVSLSTSVAGVERLERIWRHADSVPGLPLEESQFTTLAEALAVRRVANYRMILDTQEVRITNPDRRDRFRFVRGAFEEGAARGAVFDRFRQVEQRRRESWVLETLGYLNHPLRADGSIAALGPNLDLIDEIKRTGDIFFPTGWLLGSVGGHQSAAAAGILAGFLARHPLPPRLRGKALQAADGLFRAAAQLGQWHPPAGLLPEWEAVRAIPKR